MRRRMMTSIVGGAKKPTARDYVQDGLVAMWDGIENVGWGEHSDNKIITDLISGVVYDLPNDATVHNDHIKFEKQSPLRINTAVAIDSAHTMESCGCITSRPTSTSNTAGSCLYDARSLFMWRNTPSGASGIIGCSSIMDDGKLHYFGFPSSNQTAMNEANAEIYGVFRSRSCDISQNTADIRGFVNGVEKIGTNTMTYIDTPVRGTVVIGNSSTTEVLIGCFRVYNRVLTVAERAKNYAIDKARFRLD